MEERFIKQIAFIIEVDKIKHIFRKTRLFDDSRHENDAEHSWHLCMMAMILQEYSNEKIDLLKVLKMVIIHDIVEIDAGDYIVYTDKQDEKKEKELAGAKRIFGLLPEDQSKEMFNLWQEFEAKETKEAKFAAALDRLEPLMQNYHTKAASWKENDIKGDRVLGVNKQIKNGSTYLWEFAKDMIEECINLGLIEKA